MRAVRKTTRTLAGEEGVGCAPRHNFIEDHESICGQCDKRRTRSFSSTDRTSADSLIADSLIADRLTADSSSATSPASSAAPGSHPAVHAARQLWQTPPAPARSSPPPYRAA